MKNLFSSSWKLASHECGSKKEQMPYIASWYSGCSRCMSVIALNHVMLQRHSPLLTSIISCSIDTEDFFKVKQEPTSHDKKSRNETRRSLGPDFANMDLLSWPARNVTGRQWKQCPLDCLCAQTIKRKIHFRLENFGSFALWASDGELRATSSWPTPTMRFSWKAYIGGTANKTFEKKNCLGYSILCFRCLSVQRGRFCRHLMLCVFSTEA